MLCCYFVSVIVHIVAKRPQDGKADIVSSTGERTRVWYRYDGLWWRPILLLVS